MLSKAILQALEDKYTAQISEADATIKIYLNHSVGIGEHPQHIEEIDKLLQKIVDAQEKLKELQAFKLLVNQKKEQVNILEKNMGVVFTLMKTPETQFRLNSLRRRMRARRWRKLKKYLNRLQEKSKS